MMKKVKFFIYNLDNLALYPLETNDIVYDCYDLKMIYDR